MKKFQEIDLPLSGEYRAGSEHLPISFFVETIPRSHKFDLLLGFFSSTAISTLATGFASFIYNGGELRMTINDVLSPEDKSTIIRGLDKNQRFDISPDLLNNYKSLRDHLDIYHQHFFECIAYLIAESRIQLKVIRPKGGKGISHYKSGLLYDKTDYIKFRSSCNFTAYGLLENLEELEIKRSWISDVENQSILEYQEYFDKIFSGDADFVEYIDVTEIKESIYNDFKGVSIDKLLKNENELLESIKGKSERSIIIKKIQSLQTEIDAEIKEPRFPFPQGPREYQDEAYQNWKTKSYSGIFAMATGTGKTITSLNCVLNEYKKTNTYKVLILVPTIALVKQWIKEAQKFNFWEIIEVSGNSNWKQDLTNYKNDIKWGIDNNTIIISTYISYTHKTFQGIFQDISKDFILIADEAHNIGANKVKATIKLNEFSKKIALSATPKRAYDPKGNELIEEYFDDHPPYCYSFTMEEAISRGFLCRYYYYPRIVHLDDDEMGHYIEISKKIQKFFNIEKGDFKQSDILERLLLQRKRIIHKAVNKFSLFKEILHELKSQKPIKYCFGYVPEGYSQDEKGEETYIIYELLKIINEFDPSLTADTYLGGEKYRDDKIRGFTEGKLNMLLAMKCLDEGVDVPRAEIGIFLSSTGNPRQFIQRRGRLIRNHKEKDFATIYDMVVVPNINSKNISLTDYSLERSLLGTELLRVAYFAKLSENFYHTKEIFSEISNYYNLDIDLIIKELGDDS